MLVKNVTAGEPITASWANALVNNVNQRQSSSISSRGVEFTKAKGGMQFANDPAWQIRITTDRKVTLNAGQIYVNGLLVKPQDSAKAESSYNQICSVTGWKDNSVKDYTEDALPIFTIEIEMPLVVDESNISDVIATLKVTKHGETNNESEDGEEDADKRKISIQLNDVEGKEIKQLVSGSIFLNYNTISFIAKDNIHLIQKVDDVTKQEILQIYNKHSFVEGDGITIEETEELEEDKAPKNVIKISTTPFSFIGKDGITIEETEEEIADENNPEKPKKVKAVTIRGGNNFSFIGKDGITIEETEEDIEDPENTGFTMKVKAVTIGGGGNMSFIGKDGITILELEDYNGNQGKEIHIFGKTISLIALDPNTMQITKETGLAGYPPNPEWEVWKLYPLTVSLIARDGIKITKSDPTSSSFKEIYEIEAKKLSFIGNDNLEFSYTEDNDHIEWTANSKCVRIVSGNGMLGMTKSTEKTDKTWNDVYTLNVPHISVIAGDNVIVEKFEQRGTHFYKVSATGGMSEIEFDPIYFTVKDGTVSLNTTALDEIITEAVNEISVNVTAEGVIEHAAYGSAEYKTAANNLSLNTTVYNVY